MHGVASLLALTLALILFPKWTILPSPIATTFAFFFVDME